MIGTGATAVQCVPHVGETAEHLYVFQRTPSSIDVRANRDTDPGWAGSLQQGWHKHRMDNFNILVSGGFQEEDLVMDGWTDIIRKLLIMVQQDQTGSAGQDVGKTMELADFEKMNQIRSRVDAIVQDQATAEALKPWYRQFCKRPCFHDEYLETFNRPNVTLVDTQGKGVERITEKGVVFDGVEYPVDCIIYATGFEVGTDYARRAGYDMYGREGLSLTQKWSTGMRTMHGMQTRGFPNLFIMGPQQGAFTVNYPHLLDEQAKHITYILNARDREQDQDVRALGDRREPVGRHDHRVLADGPGVPRVVHPGYYNNEGNLSNLNAQNSFFGGGSILFFQMLQQWRDEGP